MKVVLFPHLGHTHVEQYHLVVVPCLLQTVNSKTLKQIATPLKIALEG